MKLPTLLSLSIVIAAAMAPYAMAEFRTSESHVSRENRANERNFRDQSHRDQSQSHQNRRDQNHRDQNRFDQSNRNQNAQWQTNAQSQRDYRESERRDNDYARREPVSHYRNEQNLHQGYTIKPTAFKPLKPHVIGAHHSQVYRAPVNHHYHPVAARPYRYPVTSVQHRHWHAYNHQHHVTYHAHYHHGVRYDAAYLLGGIVLGVLLSERTPLEGYYYSDGYRDYDYVNVRSDACYESFYRDGRRMLIEVDRYYCR